MNRLGLATKPSSTRRRFWLAMSGFALALVLAPFSYRIESRLETAVHIQGGEAEAVDRKLTEDFRSPYAHRVVVVVQGLPDPDSAKGIEALDFMSNALRAESGVSGVLSRMDLSDPVFLGKGGGTLIIVGLDPGNGSVEALVPKLRAQTRWMENQLRGRFPAIKLELTGETPLNFDLRKASADDVSHAEVRALPVTLVLLLLAFGSLIAALLPLGVGVLAIAMTMGAAAFLSSRMDLSILVENLATMLGLGLGIDYALLMVNRFREALAEGHDVEKAADIAAGQAGRTLVISASTVAIGFAVLLTVPISELRSIGAAGLLVAGMSVMLCTFVLPWVLGLLGTRVNSWRLNLSWRRKGRQGGIVSGQNAAEQGRHSESLWTRWGSLVTGRPWTALLLSGLPLLLLASQARRISPGLPPGDWLPATAESVQAFHSLEGMERAGIVTSLRVVLELPPNAPVRSQAGWSALGRLTATLAADARAAEVISLQTSTGMSESAESVDFVTEDTRRSFLSSDGLATLMEVLPAAGVTSSEQVRWVRELRSADVAKITGVPGAVLRVGGIGGLNADYEDVVRKRLPAVIEGVVGGSFVALLLGLRSLFAAAKAVLLNLLSVGAAFGALVLVFQDGHGSKLFGVEAATVSVFPMVPILTFAIVFGLSMDYEVFLVSRVLQERRRGLPERSAVIEGLASTAGLITSAAAIMIAVFAAFTMGSFLVIKMLGFTLAVAVFIDATVVRMVVGPALLQLAGDWNWWPFGLQGSAAAPVVERDR
ncbi:MMPL family transporter [Acidicapsa acidisoli]|uniref:MMPL family transporter n=1 Tax=Acidicapsa acidisoli TaxID=1615681 RepID=UPI0021E0D580|nr:MMPL family transporter [Acidicapsa acidisoli]